MYAMHDELIRRLNETKTMSIVGMCKNAGKTTMLNWMLTGGHLQGTLGLTSIGRDGESTDVVTGTEKPGIFVREGTLIATAKDMLRLGDVTKEILMTTGIPTPLGEVVIMRARSAGYVQLAGPSITTQLRSVSESFLPWGRRSPSSTVRWGARAWVPGRWRRALSCVPAPATTPAWRRSSPTRCTSTG